MRGAAVVACLWAWVLPAGVKAQEVETPNWSIGAGLTFFSFQTSLGAGALFGVQGVALQVPAVPSANVVLERKLGERVYALMGVTGGYSKSAGEAAPEPSPLPNSVVTWGAAASAGARYLFSDESSPVLVSVFGVVNGGYTSARQSFPTRISPSGETIEFVAVVDALSGGANAGVTVDLKLLERLSLRLSTSVLGVSYVAGSVGVERPELVQVADRSTLSAGVQLSPALELRVFF